MEKMSKIIITNPSTVRTALNTGVNLIGDAVGATLGPRGQYCIYERIYNTPRATKDGVSVAKEIYVADGAVDQAIQMIKQAASNTADRAGDGTTTSTVLAQELWNLGYKAIENNSANPVQIKRGMEAALAEIIPALEKMSKRIDGSEGEIKHIAKISSNGDEEISRLLTDAITRVGKDGVITVDEAPGAEESYNDIRDGLQFDRGYIHPLFINKDNEPVCIYEDVFVLISKKSIQSISDIIALISELNARNEPILINKPVIIIAPDFENSVLSILIQNKARGFNVVAVKAPGFGSKQQDELDDIATAVGATPIDGLMVKFGKDLKKEYLGVAEKIIVTRDTTTIIGGGSNKADASGVTSTDEAIMGRIQLLKQQMSTTSSEYEKEKIQQRIGKLTGGLCIYRVAAATEAEMGEKKARIEDALGAIRAAIAEGIVPGGGIALLRASKTLEHGIEGLSSAQQVGVGIVRKAMLAPITKIITNAGGEADVIISKIMLSDEESYGYDADTDACVNMIEAGIIDPTKVVKEALKNAVSIVGLLLNTKVLIYGDPDHKAHEQSI